MADRKKNQQLKSSIPWKNAQKDYALVNGPGYEKAKYTLSSVGQGDGDMWLRKEKQLKASPKSYVSPRTQTNRGDLETAFGFPTIHQKTQAEKKKLWHMAGVPQDNFGNKHTKVIENEKLVTKSQHLQNCIRIF